MPGEHVNPINLISFKLVSILHVFRHHHLLLLWKDGRDFYSRVLGLLCDLCCRLLMSASLISCAMSVCLLIDFAKLSV